jgi:hypothetical protein
VTLARTQHREQSNGTALFSDEKPSVNQLLTLSSVSLVDVEKLTMLNSVLAGRYPVHGVWINWISDSGEAMDPA